MLKPKSSKKFKKDIKRFEHRKNEMLTLKLIIDLLLKKHPLDEKHCDHSLTGNWNGNRECHVKPDLLLIYKTNKDTLFLQRLGSHAELFD